MAMAQKIIASNTKKHVHTRTIFLFAPNLVGYARIILLIIALCAIYLERPVVFVTSYCISCLLDAVDGNVARLLNQCSRFGAVLDMVTDRCTTLCLILSLAQIYPRWSLLFQFLVALDLSSHYMHMYSSLMKGSTSHKKIGPKGNKFLRFYYESQKVLFFVCFGNEAVFVLLYMAHYSGTYKNVICSFLFDNAKFLLLGFLPVCIIKQVFNVIQLYGASLILAEYDVKEHEAKMNNPKC